MKTRRPEIDLFRAAAIVGVLFIHNLYDWEPTTLNAATTLWHLAGCSVLIFFFLSGLLSRPANGPGLAVRLRRFADLLLTWLLWGIAYTLLGKVAQELGLVPPIPNLFSSSYPFFSFAYQLYFLVVLALIQALQAVWLGAARYFELPHRAQAAFELLLAAALLVFTLHGGWPPVAHGPLVALYPLYGLAYLTGVVQARSPHLGFSLAALTAFGCLVWGETAGPAWFLILAPPLALLSGRLLRSIPERVLAPLTLLSACSGAIFLLHHPLLLPLSRRFWRLWGLPDSVNYALCIVVACLLPILLVLMLRPWLLRWPWLARLLLVQPHVFRSVQRDVNVQ